MNDVDVDEVALAAEAAAVDVGAEYSPAAGDAAAASVVTDEAAHAEQFAQRALPVVRKVMGGLMVALAPNWSISDQQHDELAGSVSYALALWFPHEIPPKYAALMMVGVSVYGIAEANRDEKGKLKPLRVRPATTAAEHGDNSAT